MTSRCVWKSMWCGHLWLLHLYDDLTVVESDFCKLLRLILLLFLLPWSASQPTIQCTNHTKYPKRCLVKDIRNLGQIAAGVMLNCTEVLMVNLLNNISTHTDSGRIVTSLCPMKVRVSEMAAMHKSKMLVLPNNCISKVENGTFMHMEGLDTLRLSRNKLSSLFKGIFQGMTRLTTLWLSENQISRIDDGSFSEFSLNGAELSLNSLNSGNSENLRNHWGMNWVQ